MVMVFHEVWGRDYRAFCPHRAPHCSANLGPRYNARKIPAGELPVSAHRRIACLSAETVETLYLLGAEERIAGITGFATRPGRARKEKPTICGFSTGQIHRILAVEPDLVLAFSDMQAELVTDAIRAGVEVHVFNQRSLEGILDMIVTLGRLVDRQPAAEMLIGELAGRLAAAAAHAASLPKRPRIYFEEWHEPMICGIGWVSELIELAGGVDIFADRAQKPAARGRIIDDTDEVIRRAPDVIIGSWCGQRFRPERLAARPGWDTIPAVRNGLVMELKSADILTPGPSAILEGLPQLQAAVQRWSALHIA